MTKGLSGSVEFQTLLIERAGNGVLCKGGIQTERERETEEEQARKFHGISD